MNRKERRQQAKKAKPVVNRPGQPFPPSPGKASGVSSSLLAYATGGNPAAALPGASSPAQPAVDLQVELTDAAQNFQAGRLDQADGICRRLLLQAPNHPDLCHLTGLIALQRGRTAEAIELMQRAIAADPNYADALVNLATALHQDRQLEAAETAYRRALVLRPDFADATYNLARLLVDLEKLDLAVELFESATKLSPNDAQIFSAMATALFKLKRTDDATGAVTTALALAPNDPAIKLKQADLLIYQESWADAGRVLEAAITSHPDTAGFQGLLGVVLREQGELDRAVDAFELELSGTDVDPDVLVNLGLTFSELGRLDDAHSSFARAVDLDPQSLSAQTNLALSLTELGRQEEAIEPLSKAATLDPSMAGVHFQLGSAYRNQAAYEHSIDAYRRGLVVNASLADEHWKLGYALALGGDVDGAVDAYHACLERSPDNAAAQFLLGAAQGDAGTVAPMGAIADIFDDVAPGYEASIRNESGDDVAKMMVQILSASAASQSEQGDTPFALALDLGCGTGRAGRAVRPLVRHLTGIDIAAAMEILTRRSKICDATQHAEIMAFFDNRGADDQPFDLMVAINSLCYFGDLQSLFLNARKHLRTGGSCVFSLYSTANDDYAVQPTGRFVHSESYLRMVAAASRFAVEKIVPMKMEDDRRQLTDGMVCHFRAAT